ncbi:hypothetical protein [Clostridium sp. YIM B02551]|uniref:hypothetical protein n=1 Tax=Clostridium sp. YIM B02551 TaxID=2910679 RepID=UPI001EEC227F|nr:hypothetical protein [Clostridium sp. YIM B02551]
MSQRYQKRPSEILNIEDEYESYCFDEALEEFILNIEKGRKPRFKSERKNKGDNPGLKLLLGSKRII